MKTPTAEEVREYDRKLEEVIAAQQAGAPDEQKQKELREFMARTGIANEAPVTDFPELSDAS